MLITDQVPAHTTVEDAEILALYGGITRSTNAYNDFVQRATS
ncbi:MAG TPA: hypothetical protein VMF12_18075 [Xanthobacteraceae bacterium]|nr:hypothetical protein [Xanthobacteraceae bacterium]